MTAHRESHVELLVGVGDGPGRSLDAVVVPAGRPVANLAAAAQIAAKTQSSLLVLCDHEARAADVRAVVEENGTPRWQAVQVPAGCLAGRLRTAEPPPDLPEMGGRVSLSQKRNLGLMVARMVGWRTVLFLDDDIRDLDPAELSWATAGLQQAAAVGFPVTDYPDNSVVCHANRISGRPQNVFVGGSALLVDTRSDLLTHFPTIYNEDWLFLFDALLRRQVGRAPNRVSQLPYDPFRDLRRGRDEEFGEIVAEGLAHYAHAPTRSQSPNHEGYWREFLAVRREFVTGVVRRLQDGPLTPGRRTALNAVRVAETQGRTVTPAHCVRFMERWRRERAAFATFQQRLPVVRGVREALCFFGLEPVSAPARPVRRYVAEPIAGPTTAEIEVVRQIAPRSAMLTVVVPGFLDSASSAGTASLTGALRRAGRTTVTFDPRGSWRNGADPAQLRPSRQVQDTVAVVRRNLPYERVALVGHSLGAHVALLAAAREPSVTDVVAVMPPRCFVWAGDYDSSRDSWRRRGIREFSITPTPSPARWRFRVPHSVVDDALTLDLPAALAGLTRPRVLFVAGRFDEVIPVKAVRRLHDECASPTKDILVLPVGHDYRDRSDHRRLVNDAVLDWLSDRPVRSRPARCEAVTAAAGPAS